MPANPVSALCSSNMRPEPAVQQYSPLCADRLIAGDAAREWALQNGLDAAASPQEADQVRH